MTCTHCGRANRADARFCDGCGGALGSGPAADPAARKIVTIVFADLVGSTALHERLDAESARLFMHRYYEAMRGAVDAHGGRVTQLLGDGVKAVFGAPRVAEDDAIRAVRAAVDMQRAFRGLAEEQAGRVGKTGLRVAVNTGEVVAGDQAEIIGDPVNVAARLQEGARDGDVVIGESTRRLVGDVVTLAPLGAFTLKGRTETVAAYRVVSLERPADAPATPFVGRDDELRRVLAVYDAAVADRRARLVVVLGWPGLGKSRLIGEVTRRLAHEAIVLTARCDSAGGATFMPLAAALRAFLGVDAAAGGETLRAAIDRVLPGDDPERVRIAAGVAALLAAAPAPPEETFFVVRRFLTALAAARPVVLAIDDLQWAEPLLLDLTEHLAQWATDVPLLVLTAARPELRDARASLATSGGLVSDVLTLGGLDAGAATRLAASVIGADALPAAVAGRVLAASEGNPLFVGELVRMLVQDGALKREGDRWTTGVALASLEMPPTIHALLAARIERLRPEERMVLERAAVVGRQFSRAAVAHLMPGGTADLDACLDSLRRGELIEPDAGWLLGEPALRFHHALIRDAAYRHLLKGTRAELHGRFADWLETGAGESVEHEETIGWHLEQAHQHLRELGPIDASGRACGERAARYLASAGRRALARDDLSLAASLLGRALDRLEEADPARADLVLDCCEALLAAGQVARAASAIDELSRLVGASARLRAWHTCFAGQLAALTDPQALRATVEAVAAAAEDLAAAGDAAGEAKAHSVHALALARLGRVGPSEAVLDRALAAARRARDRRRANALLAGAPLAALWGPSSVERASGRCLDVVRVLRITQGAPAVEAVALRCQGVLEALRGRSEAARRMIASSRRMVEELGITHRLLEADVFAGMIDLLEGDAVAAEGRLRAAYDGLRAGGLGIDAAQAAALLGRALLAQDRAAEAEALSHESEALAGDDFKAAIAWRGVRAEALARRGEHAAAADLARAAVDIAAATDALLDHADARAALAVVLRADDRGDEAAIEEARALELWEAKGATLLADRARRAAGGTERAHRDPEDGTERARSVRRRVRANAATANAARFDAAVAARDADALPDLLADHSEVFHHPTGTAYDRRGALATWRSLLKSEDAALRHEPRATLGESLALLDTVASVGTLAADDVAPFGPVRITSMIVMEVDAQGRRTWAEFFAPERLGDAVARLYERYAETLPAGTERVRAALIARSAAALLGPPDLDAYAAAFAPDIEFVDHRTGGFKPGRGRERLLRGFRAMFDLASEVAIRVDEILDLRSDGLLVRWSTSGTDRVSGGTYEYDFLLLWAFGADGLLTHNEQFDPGREDQAFSRFDGLMGASPVMRFANAATRNSDAFMRSWDARDWEGVVATADPAMRVTDRRALTGLDLEGPDFFANLRFVFDVDGSRWHGDVLATRGDRLALHRWRLDAGERGARSEVEFIGLNEVDAGGRQIGNVVFDSHQLVDAYAELDDAYSRGEGAPAAAVLAGARAFQRASAARDWATVAELLSEDFTLVSHRRLVGTAGALGRDEYLASRGTMDDLVRGDLRFDHVLRSAEGRIVSVVSWYGTVYGGTFEDPFVAVLAHDGRRFRSIELFDLEQLDAALARYEELSATRPAAARITNAVTRSMHEFQEAWDARDWERVAAVFAPGFHLFDRRPMMHLDLDRDGQLESQRVVFEMSSSRYHTEVLATRGERLALLRGSLKGTDRSVGPMEVEFLLVAEVNEGGERIANVSFDPDDLAGAYAELDARYSAGEAAAFGPVSTTMRAFKDAFARRDWDALGATFTPDLVGYDHRLLGWETLQGPAAYVQAVRSLVDLAPDARLRLDHVTMSDRGLLWVAAWHGSNQGGAFEVPWIIVSEHDAAGKVRRFDQYDVDQLEAARARFDAIGAEASP